VFLWFAGTAVLSVWIVFHDPQFDYRLLVLGAILPDLVDAFTGGAWVMHSITGSVLLLVVVMLSTIGRRPLRRRLLALPIGTFLHLVFDGAFANTSVFWWPFTGLGFDDEPLPSVQRGATSALMEIAGLGILWWFWRRFDLADPARRRVLLREGHVSVDP
jgi:hypothetical protein